MGEASRGGMESPRIKPEPSIAPVQPVPRGGEEKEAPPEATVVYTHNDDPAAGRRDPILLAVVAVVAVACVSFLAYNGFGESSAAISILSFASTAVGALAGISYAQRGR